MKELTSGPVLVAGNGHLTCSIVVCLLRAGYRVKLKTDDPASAAAIIHDHLSDANAREGQEALDEEGLELCHQLEQRPNCPLAIVITEEDIRIKRAVLAQLESCLPATALIAINAESIGLDQLQQHAQYKDRILGLNWTEPAHTTRFLEIIHNATVRKELIPQMIRFATSCCKDPYVVINNGIRSRMMSAMVREAFYLMENGYATMEDIDRACRNDAGYYLPFAGNCRYMDLMGTYAYGIVMKDLNPDLSKAQHLPQFFVDIIKEGGLGMQNGKGLYSYTPEEVRLWRETFNEFSYQIEALINKYPFNYQKDTSI